MYWYCKLINYEVLTDQLEDPSDHRHISQDILHRYLDTLAKLTYFVMTEGWRALIKRTKMMRQGIWGLRHVYGKGQHSHFTNDIFRDVECDILYFVLLRHIFGTKNYLL